MSGYEIFELVLSTLRTFSRNLFVDFQLQKLFSSSLLRKLQSFQSRYIAQHFLWISSLFCQKFNFSKPFLKIKVFSFFRALLIFFWFSTRKSYFRLYQKAMFFDSARRNLCPTIFSICKHFFNNSTYGTFNISLSTFENYRRITFRLF